MEVKPNILIAIPAYGGSIKTPCVESLIDLKGWLVGNSIAHDTLLIDLADVVLARNFIATYFLRSSFTHLLFIDSDMRVPTKAVERLINARRPLIGCIYPKRSFDFGRAFDLMKSSTRERAMAVASDFAVRHLPQHRATEAKIKIENGKLEVAGIGMGVCLIERGVFAALEATGKIATYRQHPMTEAMPEPLLGFFDRMQAGEMLLLEDESFCERWRTLCEGQVWGDFGVQIGHVYSILLDARYAERLAAGHL